jgi:uncharacterized protein
MVKLDAIPPEGLSSEFVIPADLVEREFRQRDVREVLASGDMEVSATVMRSGADVFVIGKFSAPVKLFCARCLEEFEIAISEEVHLDLTTEPFEFENATGEFELSAAELEVDRLKGDAVNLEDIFLEQLILALPEHPVCSKECGGLCPGCGKKTGGKGCDCARGGPVSPFAVLAGLKPKK